MKAKTKIKAVPKPPAKNKGKTAVPTKKTEIELITLRTLAASVAEKQGVPLKEANSVLSEAVDLMKEHLKAGARIRIAGLGTLEVRDRPARKGRNPATGEEIDIKAGKKVVFRTAKDLSEAI